jgi:hypothetical protein
LIRKKGHWEALIIEIGSPNYTKVGAKMTNLGGKTIDVLSSINKGLGYINFRATKFLLDFKDVFDKPSEVKDRKCSTCNLQMN